MKTSFIFFLISAILIIGISPISYADEESIEEQIKNDAEFEQNSKEAMSFFSFGNILKMLCDALKNAFSPSIPLFSGLVGMVIVSSVLSAFEINLGGKDISSYISALCFSGYCFSIVKHICTSLSDYLVKLRELSTVVAPALASAGISEGVASAQVGYTGLVTVTVVAEYLITCLVMPCVKFLFVLSLVSRISAESVDLKGISSAARTFTVFSVSLVMTGIVTVMHFQNIIAGAADSVGLRAIRFTTANLIPIIGPLVGESAKTVAEALRAVKGISGVLGVSAVITACLPPLAATVIFKLELIFCNILAKTLGCTGQAEILSETNGILNVLNAALLSCTIAFAAMICIAASLV